MATPSPEQARGWLQTVLALTREGGPVSLLLVIILASISIYGLVGEVKRVHEVNKDLWLQLIAAQKEQVELARHCAQTDKESP